MTPEGDAILRAGREAFQPSSEVRARVFHALASQLGGNLEDEWAKEAPRASSPSNVGQSVVLPALVGIGIVAAGLFLALRPTRPRAPTERVVSVAAPRSVPVAPSTPRAAPIAASPPSADAPWSTAREPPVAAAAPKPAAARPAADGLAQEVAILSRAGAELHAGRPAAALAALAEHQRRFPAGVLTQERSAARAQALCALGRSKEARAELERLARMSPNSPLEAQARKACGSALDE